MVPVFTTAACVFTLIVCLIAPVVAMLVYARGRKGVVSAWIIGALGFLVTQMAIRLPILTALGSRPGFVESAQSHPIVYGLCLAATAALFELAGRLGAAALLRRNLTHARAFAAGMGHGGIEAMVLIGLTYVNNLAYIIMINTGAFDAAVASAAAAGVDPAQLEAIRQALVSTSGWMFLLASLERVLTMICHTAMSSLVCFGFSRGKTLQACAACFAIHFVMDASASLTLVLPQKAAYPAVYAVLIAMTVLCIGILRYIHRNWEVSHAEKL